MLNALIFDMDGTLVHSDPVHLRAFAEVLGPEGVEITDEVYRDAIIGHTNESIFEQLLPRTVRLRTPNLRRSQGSRTFRRLARELEPLRGAA